MATTYQAKMDIRGFLRFSEDTVSKLGKMKGQAFADVFVDPVGGRIGISISSKLKENSFRILDTNESRLLYLKGALNAVKSPVKSGDITLTQEGDKLVFQCKKSAKKGSWTLLACRNSAGLPMISLDTRGTLILDRRCIDALKTKVNDTLTPAYDAKKKSFSLTFGKKGLVNVRTIQSHASVSFMGTLSSFGIDLPKERLRTSVAIKGNTLTFKLAH